MIALIAIAWGVVLAVACGGDLRRLGALHLAGAPVVLSAFLIQGIARGRLLGVKASSWGVLVWGAASLLLVTVLVVWTLRRSDPVVVGGGTLVAIGTGLNLLVVLANAAMPVASVFPGIRGGVDASAGFYTLANRSTSLAALGDVLPLQVLGVYSLLSVGDVLLVMGVAIVLCEATLSGLPPSDRCAGR